MKLLLGIVLGIMASASIAVAATHLNMIRLQNNDWVFYAGVRCRAGRLKPTHLGNLTCLPPDAGKGYAVVVSRKAIAVFPLTQRGAGKFVFYKSQP